MSNGQPDDPIAMPEPGPAIYTYDPDANVHGASLPGVPLRDLTAQDLARLPDWLRPSIDACPFYTRVQPLALPDEE